MVKRFIWLKAWCGTPGAGDVAGKLSCQYGMDHQGLSEAGILVAD